MKKEELYEAMNDIDEEYLELADTYKSKKKNRVWVKWLAATACLFLVLSVLQFIPQNVAPVEDESQNPQKESAVAEGEDLPSQTQDSETNVVDEMASGLYIPAIELPNTSGGVEADMIALVVYQGGIYTQGESYYGKEALAVDSLLGDYLGYATGSIDEWSAQEEYAKEFASSVAGNVYAVNGYDTDFRICIREEFEDENGEKELWIMFLNHLNGIYLETGADLFETRLHMRDRIVNIQWQSHDDWNYEMGNMQTTDLEASVWDEFFEQIDKSEFVNEWEYSGRIYDTQNQVHLYLTMEDGTRIELRLIEGGYVGYDGLGWYFVEIPGETFDEVFTACGGKLQ